MNDEDLKGLFRDMRDEALPPDSLARVRMAVEERTVQQARGRAWWRWGLGAAAAALWVALGPYSVRVKVAPRNSPPIAESPRVSPLETRPPATKASANSREQPVAAASVRARAPKPPRPAMHKQVEPKGSLIRLETSDPDVVLYFVADGPGE